MECGANVEGELDEERANREREGEERPNSSASKSSRSHSSRENSPIREASMVDVIGSSNVEAEGVEKKLPDKKKSALKRVLAVVKLKKLSQGGDKETNKLQEDEEVKGQEGGSGLPRTISFSKLFHRVHRPSVSKGFSPFGRTKQNKEGEICDDNDEHNKAGSSKTLGRIMKYIGTSRAHGRKPNTGLSGLEDEDIRGPNSQPERTMTLGRRIARIGSTFRGMRSSSAERSTKQKNPSYLPKTPHMDRNQEDILPSEGTKDVLMAEKTPSIVLAAAATNAPLEEQV